MRCTICQHERRAQIEMGLVFGTSRASWPTASSARQTPSSGIPNVI
jgi:hypothetical protein